MPSGRCWRRASSTSTSSAVAGYVAPVVRGRRSAGRRAGVPAGLGARRASIATASPTIRDLGRVCSAGPRRTSIGGSASWTALRDDAGSARARPRRSGSGPRARSSPRSTSVVTSTPSWSASSSRRMPALAGDARVAPATGDAAPRAGDAVVLPLRPFRGELDWPAEGAVVSPFGPRVNPASAPRPSASGIEIAAAEAHAGARRSTTAPWRSPTRSPASAYSSSSITATRRTRCTVTSRRLASSEARTSSGAACRDRRPRPDSAGRRCISRLRIDGQPVDPVQWLKSQGRNLDPSCPPVHGCSSCSSPPPSSCSS